MSALKELLAIEKEIEEKIKNSSNLINKMVQEEAEALGKSIIESLKDYRSDTASNEGYMSDYIALCHQTHFYERHAYSELMNDLEYSFQEYTLPEELRKLVNDEDTEIIYDQDGEIIKDELTELESEIVKAARSYVMGVLEKDSIIADREAVLRGEIESGREEEYRSRDTFEDSREAARFKDKAKSSDYNYLQDEAETYEQLRTQLFNYFGIRFVKSIMKHVINNLKKQPANKYQNLINENDYMLRTVWDVMCTHSSDWSYFENEVRSLIYDELYKLNATERILLWYFNTYKNNSKLDLRLDCEEIGWKGAGIRIEEQYNCEEEITDVMYQRIMWSLEEYSNYRLSFWSDEHSQEMLEHYRGEAVEPFENKTSKELAAEYKNRFNEEFPLDAEQDKDVLLECVASDTPWSKDIDLTITIKNSQEEDNNTLFKPELWKKGYRFGNDCIINGVDTLRDWTKAMMDRCGIEIKPWLGAIWETIHAFDNEDVDADTMTASFKLVERFKERYPDITTEKICEMLIEATADEDKDKVKKFSPYIKAAHKGFKELRNPTDVTRIINETIEAICKDNKQDSDVEGEQNNHTDGDSEAKKTSVSDILKRFEEANENSKPLPLNEDSTPESLQLLDELIEEDKKANPEKYAQWERENRERSDKSYNAYVLRNKFRDACSLTEMIDKIKVYGTEEYSPFYDTDRSRFLWDYEQRGKQGDAETQYEVGCIYEHGWWGIPIDIEKAREWYEKAAEQGKVEAQLRLAGMYEYGWPFKKDLKKAIYWYQKAAETGDAAAQCILGDIYCHGWWGTIENKEKAFEWYLKAAEQGNALAQYEIGSMHDKSREGAMWYEKAAMQGNKRAQNSLGWLYERGYGVDQDYVKAFDWYMKSASQGYIYGYLYVGLMYYEGHGVQKDYKKAVDWFRKAAEKGLAEGQYHLGVMYLNGWGVKKDLDWASHWFYLAAENGHHDAKFCTQNMWQRRIQEETLAKKDSTDSLANETGYPSDIYDLIQKMKEYALEEEDKWYESLGSSYWVVKGASEEIVYKDKFYIIYPKDVCCKTHAFFEHMMINKFEAELKALGATYVRCTGMID